jgi:hypothetical protein
MVAATRTTFEGDLYHGVVCAEDVQTSRPSHCVSARYLETYKVSKAASIIKPLIDARDQQARKGFLRWSEVFHNRSPSGQRMAARA